MKNIHLISAMYSSRGHSREYVRNFCKQLGGSFNINLFQAQKDENLAERLMGANITRISVDYLITDAKNFTKYYYLAPYIRSLVKQIQSYKYYKLILNSRKIKKDDIVFIMDYDVIPLYFLINRLKKEDTRIILWIHSARFSSKDLLYTIYKGIFKFIFKKYLQETIEKVIVNGDYISNSLKNNLEVPDDKILIIQYPTEILFPPINKKEAKINLGIPPETNTVLFFGLLRKDKNLEMLIHSISKCKTKLTLIIAGAEASVTKNQIEFWLEKYNLNNAILDINYIEEDKMALYYSSCDLLVITYITESASQSGPLSLAREFELPAIVPDAGEIGYYVKSNKVGFTAQHYNAECFSREIDRFFTLNNDQLNDLKTNLRAAKKNFSWEAAGNTYKSIFLAK